MTHTGKRVDGTYGARAPKTMHLWNPKGPESTATHSELPWIVRTAQKAPDVGKYAVLSGASQGKRRRNKMSWQDTWYHI